MELKKYLCPEMTVYSLSLEGMLCQSGFDESDPEGPQDGGNEGAGYKPW